MSVPPHTTPPRFSVVVPVHRVQGYLRECLDSVLRQSFTDVELVAVDDASPDGSGRILEEYAARDDRLVLVRLAENGGIGHARDTGVRHATGDYVLFLDGDDTLADGALQALADRLDGAGDPDILLFDHVRTYWWGLVQRSAAADMLREGRDAVFTALERPEYLTMFAVVWNRLYRREFYVDGGFAFTDGVYEDMLMVYRTMLTARRIACLDRVCVEYRQRRRGNSMRTPGRSHFAIFEQYDRLFAYLAESPAHDAVRPLLYERMVSHFLFTLARTDRIPPELRHEFFREAAARARRHRPEGFEAPQGVAGLKFNVLARGSYAAFQAFKAANGTRKQVRRQAGKAKTRIGRQAYRRLYGMHLRRPLDDNLVVYSAYWNRGVACNPAAIHRKATELAPHLRHVWVVRKDAVDTLPPGVDHVVAGSPRYWQVMARAKYLVNNVNFPNEIVKRPGQVHIQTHHGTPLKQMGIDQQRYPAAARGMSFRQMLERADRWDYSLASNQHSTETWERVYPCSFESVDSGYPRNDVYFTATADDVRRIREGLGIPEGTTAILYAPTVRDYQKGFVPRLDLARLCRELGPGHVLLVRAHYFYGADPGLQALEEAGLIRDVSRHPDVEELCLAADALVTDYSSVMFDYACLDRPIVSYAPDWEVYSKARGVYFDLLSGRPGETPGAVATDEDALIEVFRSGAWKGRAAGELRAAFRERFVQYDDGRAAERVVRRLFLGERELPPVLPLERRTPAPAPSALTTGRTVVTAPGAAPGAAVVPAPSGVPAHPTVPIG